MISNQLGPHIIKRGKIRDIWSIVQFENNEWKYDEEHILIFTSNRISVFDKVLPFTIKGKGKVLTEMTRFWCERTKHIIPNHISESKMTLKQALPDYEQREEACAGCEVVRSFQSFPIEVIVRHYLTGSAIKEYEEHGTVGFQQIDHQKIIRNERLPSPIVCYTTKAENGEHDQPIRFEDVIDVVGVKIARDIFNKAIQLYYNMFFYCFAKGYILADTKYEFALNENRDLVLIDEVGTPDCSRFWKISYYDEGKIVSFDKDIIRTFVSSFPEEKIPKWLIENMILKYQQVATDLMS